jgi:peptidyl-prolyl cis-trans isomerase A (cyclophilin A)
MNFLRSRRCTTLAVAVVWLFSLSTTVAAEAANPVVRFTTTAGDIDIELLRNESPKTVANILALVGDGFYEGLTFHRVIPGFMIQGGGYDANLNYRKPPGTVVNESSNGVRNLKGMVAMARLSDPDSASSQFFINVANNLNLDATRINPGYTVFGKVVAGMYVVAQIENVPTQNKGGMSDVPSKPIVITSAKLL